jgi:hypothetical protein
MTRETKLGLGVGTSFLSLVAVVAFHAWTRTEEPPPAPEVPPPVAVVASGPQVPADLPLHNTNVVQVGGKETAPAVVPDLPAAALPAPPPLPSQQTPPVPVPLPGGTPGLPPLPPLPGNPGNSAPALVAGGPKPDVSVTLPPPPPGTDPIPKAGQVQLPPTPKQPSGLPGFPPPPEMPPAAGPGLPPLPGDFDHRPALDALVASGAAAVPVPMVKAPSMPPGIVDVADLKPPLPPGGPKPVVTPQDLLPPPPGAPKDLLPPPPGAPRDPGPVPQIGGQGGFTSPTIKVPALPPAGGGVTVESHRESLYKCEPGDRSFADVSKRRYLDEKYAEALYEYNRNHPLGKDAASHPAALQPGNVVAVPTLDVLQGQYGKLIPDNGSSPVSISTPGSPEPPPPVQKLVPVVTPPSNSAPVPVVKGPTADALVPPPMPQPKDAANLVPAKAATPPQPGTKQYWVPQGGRHFFEIARETMGDGKLWYEIWHLNQQYDPHYMVPAGAQLQLPASARVGP